MISIDPQRCVNCGSCIRSCSMGVLGPGEATPQVLSRRRCIACGHCVAICPRQAVTLDGSGILEAPADPVERLVMSRRSVRHFKNETPDRETVQWALDRAQYAPSGKNIHATGWTVVWGHDAAEDLIGRVLTWCDEHGEAPELRKLYDRGTNLLTCGAPCVLLGWSPDDCLNPVVDTAVAMTTVELLLQTKGVATCWGGYLVQVLNAAPELRDLLGIPAGSHVRCALMVGHADRERYPGIPTRPAAEPVWVTDLNGDDDGVQ
jgi:ferredoxin